MTPMRRLTELWLVCKRASLRDVVSANEAWPLRG
jgi:hypothetical protein